ncbi:MAG: tRNA (adenosine(37)-N6)-threonylcarbamoyltransferase complex transferase subunit TsaD [Patescibacteria group bacterium]
MKILGIETSCDETAVAVVEGPPSHKLGTQNLVFLRSNIVSSQINIHKKYGGVVPEVAAREHVTKILPVVNEALEKAGIKREQAAKKITAIAVTAGPGLITSLITGIETAKVLSYVWSIPLIAINHIEAHIYANFINERSDPPSEAILRAKRSSERSDPPFPALILTVSGGHTMLVLMKGHGKYQTIGQTRDDAAGEAFDKAAQLLGLGYPGGPIISKYADKFTKQNPEIQNYKLHLPAGKAGITIRQLADQNSKPKISKNISLPRPMLNSNNFDFSFSGLKTALLYAIKKDPLRLAEGEASKLWKKRIPEYCYEFQQAVIDVLIYKTIKAAKKYNVTTIMLTGGVAANKELRRQMDLEIKKHIPCSALCVPCLEYTTDNAAMVATAGYFFIRRSLGVGGHAIRKVFTPWQKIKVNPNLEL